MSETVGSSYGVASWAGVWKTVQAGSDGVYYATMFGHYRGIVSAAGGAFAQVIFEFRVKDLTTGEVANRATIASAETVALWGVGIEGNFETTVAWTGISGHQYGLEAYVYTYTIGVVGSAIADGYDPEGIYYDSLEVWKGSLSGCVAEGIGITLVDGTTSRVEDLKPGDWVIGYDLSTGRFVAQTVLSNDRTWVDLVEVINGGLLVLTPEDQPVYARYGDFEGWVMNPVDLRVGWEVFHPSDQTWLTIERIEYVRERFSVYELSLTAPNNYLANGILLDEKI